MKIKNEGVIKTALHELVEHGKHGFVFNMPNQLEEYILSVSNDKDSVNKFKKYIEKFREYKWDNECRKTMKETKCFEFD